MSKTSVLKISRENIVKVRKLGLGYAARENT